jgi:hypothetical protein
MFLTRALPSNIFYPDSYGLFDTGFDRIKGRFRSILSFEFEWYKINNIKIR